MFKMALMLHVLHRMSGGLHICSSSTKEICGHKCKEPSDKIWAIWNQKVNMYAYYRSE